MEDQANRVMEKRRTSHGNARCGDVTMTHDDWSTPLVRAYADEAVWDNIFHPLLTGWFAFEYLEPSRSSQINRSPH